MYDLILGRTATEDEIKVIKECQDKLEVFKLQIVAIGGGGIRNPN